MSGAWVSWCCSQASPLSVCLRINGWRGKFMSQGVCFVCISWVTLFLLCWTSGASVLAMKVTSLQSLFSLGTLMSLNSYNIPGFPPPLPNRPKNCVMVRYWFYWMGWSVVFSLSDGCKFLWWQEIWSPQTTWFSDVRMWLDFCGVMQLYGQFYLLIEIAWVTENGYCTGLWNSKLILC